MTEAPGRAATLHLLKDAFLKRAILSDACARGLREIVLVFEPHEPAEPHAGQPPQNIKPASSWAQGRP